METIENKLRDYGTVEKDVSLKDLTTFKVGGKADYLVYPNNHFSLIGLINFLYKNEISYKVLGNGSNILASDDDYHGVIIKLNRTFNDFSFDGNVLNAQAGCSIVALSYKAMNNSLSNLEFASGIPATLGGCIYMNAGAYKSDMSNVILEVEVLVDGEIKVLTNQQCEFSYRNSIFQKNPDWIILSAKIQLKNANAKEIKALMDERQNRRLESQPLEYPCAGSTFRNPNNIAAWQLIDQAGLRGKNINGAQISEKHSNFIINRSNACAQDIAKLADLVIETVKEKFNITLKMEVEKFNWKK